VHLYYEFVVPRLNDNLVELGPATGYQSSSSFTLMVDKYRRVLWKVKLEKGFLVPGFWFGVDGVGSTTLEVVNFLPSRDLRQTHIRLKTLFAEFDYFSAGHQAESVAAPFYPVAEK